MQYKNQQFRLSATDIVNHLGCNHLTELNRQHALGEIDKPEWSDPALVVLQEKGYQHEQSYTEFLKNQGLNLFNAEGLNSTEVSQILEKGYDVIAQARLKDGAWAGYADFLRKVPGESDLGDYHYEVLDTKLAQNTRAGTVLQLSLYSQILGKLQGKEPERMYVVKPGEDFPMEEYFVASFRSYFNLVKTKLDETIASGEQETQPVPVPKCGECIWWKRCDKEWHDKDHLSLIAGLRASQLVELESQGFSSLEEYADFEAPLKQMPKKGNEATFKKAHDQARVQLRGRKEKKKVYDLLPVEEARGLNRLPVPTKGDIYFDFEGDHFYEDGGLEYLFGLVHHNDSGELIYTKFWAKNRQEEKEAFVAFMDFLFAQWKEYPGFHIYHYAAYEPAAIKRLATRHAVREDEVDRILRAQRFVDLHRVIKESLQASVESYSLKELEAFTEYIRKADLFESAQARRRLGAALEFDVMDKVPELDYALIEEYNEDDCLATQALHEWLERIYQEVSKKHPLQRPELLAGEASERVDEMSERARFLFDALTKDLPEDEWTRDEEARWLLAHMVEYYRREEKNSWWEFFSRDAMEDDEIFEDRKGIAYLTFEAELPKQPRQQVSVHQYSFPNQEISIKVGNTLHEIQGEIIGKVQDISSEEGWVLIRKTKAATDIHPTSVHVKDVFNHKILTEALHRFIQEVIDHGLGRNGRYDAGKDLLLSNAPNLGEGTMQEEVESVKDAAIRIVGNLDHSILPIQGPPGTGKTYTGALMILDLIKKGKKIGVTAVSHKAIRNLLLKVAELAPKEGVTASCYHLDSHDADCDKVYHIHKKPDFLKNVAEGAVGGATTFMWAREEADGALDYLFVDEAGQMSLSNVLAIAGCAKNIVLLGDPQQLEQPQQGAHPESSDISALSHLLDGRQTMAKDKGLFLDTTWRFPSAIAAYTSEIFYENRLKARKELEGQMILGDHFFSGNGLYYHPVAHKGNQNHSEEECEAIVNLVNNILAAEPKWVDSEGVRKKITNEDIMIIAPYNAQVDALSEKLPEFRIGTVDKFQGQEAPIVIYSMAASSPEDAPRGMGFLYSPNRLNVATSRAECICILVAAPQLMEPECHSIPQMEWVNALCRYKELAKVV